MSDFSKDPLSNSQQFDLSHTEVNRANARSESVSLISPEQRAHFFKLFELYRDQMEAFCKPFRDVQVEKVAYSWEEFSRSLSRMTPEELGEFESMCNRRGPSRVRLEFEHQLRRLRGED